MIDIIENLERLFHDLNDSMLDSFYEINDEKKLSVEQAIIVLKLYCLKHKMIEFKGDVTMSKIQVTYTTGDIECFNNAEIGFINSRLDDKGEKTKYVKITSEGHIYMIKADCIKELRESEN